MFSKHFKELINKYTFHIRRVILFWRSDCKYLILLLSFSLPIWFWFGNQNFIIFWDGWAPMSPLLQFTQNFNTVFLPQIGAGVYSFGYTSYSIILVSYTLLGILLGPMAAERLFYFLSFAFSGITMFYLIKDFSANRRYEMGAFLGAIYYMYNFYWISGVFEDLLIPTVLTFLPLFFLLYRRYLNEIKTKRTVISPYLFLSVFSLVLIPGIFYQQSVPIFTFILIYTLFSMWFSKDKGIASSVSLLRLLGFIVFTILTFITYAYFLWPQFIFSNIVGNYSGLSSFSLSYLQALTSKATFFNVIRDIQPSSFFSAPFSFNQSVGNLATNAQLSVALLLLAPTIFAFISPAFTQRKNRKEGLSLLLILLIVIFFQMGISGPVPSIYLWLGEHLYFGSILEDPNITLGFLEPFLISILIGIGFSGLTLSPISALQFEDSKQNFISGNVKKSYLTFIKLKTNSKKSRVVTYSVATLIISSSFIAGIPIFTGSFIPSYNSFGYSSYGPTISSHVIISPEIKEVMDGLRKYLEGKRVLVLPLESGINMQTGNLSYVTSNSVLQLETGADIISDNTYGFGQNSSYILSSINNLIYNTFYFLHKNYSMDQYFISTEEFSNFLSSFGIQYVLVVPGVPETPINSYYPLVTYNMSKFFISVQKNVTEVYQNNGYILYENTQKMDVVSNKIDAFNSFPSKFFVSDFASSIQWDRLTSTNNISHISFDKGFIFNYQANEKGIFVLPASRLNISTQNFSFMNIAGEAVNATVSFYYVYEFKENYTLNGSMGTIWFPMTRYSQTYSSVPQSENFRNITFSTQIPFFPWLGTGNVTKIDWIEIFINPSSDLKPGDQFGFKMNNMYFSNFSSSLSAISYSLSKNPSTDYIPMNSKFNHLIQVNLSSPRKIIYQKVSPSKFEFIINGSHGLLLLNLPISYSTYWKYNVVFGLKNLTSIHQIETDGFQNSYLINASGNVTIEIFYEPLRIIQSFAFVSLLSIITQFLCLFFIYRLKRKGRRIRKL